MKKIILLFVLNTVLVFVGISAFGQSNRKVTKARHAVVVAKNNLREAKIDSAADYRNFRKHAEMGIRENQKTIADLKLRKNREKKEINDRYDKDINEMIRRNAKIQKRYYDSQHVKTNKWSSFKREFNHDMDDFGHAFRNIGVNNIN